MFDGAEKQTLDAPQDLTSAYHGCHELQVEPARPSKFIRLYSGCAFAALTEASRAQREQLGVQNPHLVPSGSGPANW